MPNLQHYVQLAGQTVANLTKKLDTWTNFLKTASRLYKYSFPDQLMIFAQKPTATAVADFNVWTKTMRRYVRRGVKGTALVDVSNGQPRIRYVFDVSDTGQKKDSCSLYLWQYKEEYRDAITTALEQHFDVPCKNGFPDQLEDIAAKLAENYWQNHRNAIMYEISGSFLDGIDEFNVGVKFCDVVGTSIFYVLISRCSLHPEKHFRIEDFQNLCDFNTQRLVQILGNAVSQSSKQVLQCIAMAIFTFEHNKTKPTQKPSTSQSHANTTQPKKPTIKEIYEQSKPIIKDFVLNDKAYQSACKNGGKESAELEFKASLKRAALNIKDLEFMRIYYAINECHNQMQQEMFTETYSMFSTIKEQKPEPENIIPDTTESVQEDITVDEPEVVTPEPEQDNSTSDTTESEPTNTDVADNSSVSVADTNYINPEPVVQTPQIVDYQADDTANVPQHDQHNITNPVLDADERALSNQEIILEASEVKEIPVTTNFRITDDQLGVGGSKAKFRMNMDAITVLKQIEGENRTATLEEQQILSKYVGWGGIPDAFDNTKEDWADEYQELKAALTSDEYNSARSSTLNAHYTSPVIVKAIYEAIGNMGFKSGNILEPSCGIGNFFGLLPDKMAGSKLYGVELDNISGRIAQQLYPNANISICGYEETDFPNNFFDIAVGNVPFGQYKVNDPKYNKLGFSIHNYFLAKTIDQIRFGGIMAVVTSRYTMDSKDMDVRKYLAERADLLGAIRLPNNAFKANANTDVVSDILFLQKRDTPAIEEPIWVYTAENADGFIINRYFLNNPDMVLGQATSESTQYGRNYTVLPINDVSLNEQLHEAISHIHGSYQETTSSAELEEDTAATTLPADSNVKNYSFTLVNGEVYYRENSKMTKPELNITAKNRVKALINLRDCVHSLINLQMDEYTSDSVITQKQTELNRLYDIFANKYGLINDHANRLAFDRDSSYYLLCSLEILDDNGKLQRKADMFTKRTIKQHKTVTSVDTASEALTVCIGERAKVDLQFMSRITGKTESELIKELHNVIYKDPAKNNWQTADEYLSGNVRRKLRQAIKAAEQDSSYQINLEALTKAQPKDLDASEIEVRIGATWIDKSYVQQFMVETLNTPYYLRNIITVNYSPITAEWGITNKGKIPYNDVAAYTTYGTNRANAYKILEDSLNLRDVRIYDTVEDADGKEKRVLNAKETTLAQQKQQALRQAFQDWIFKDAERRQTLVKLYNELMNSTRPREYDGSHIVFPGINPAIKLQPHQLNAIARVLYGGNTLLAHEVGAGKTFEMIASAMESKRLGLCHKAICVVPNHLTEQTATEWLRLYPAANILVTTKKDFETANRKKFCARIATSDIDAVIIGHSQFERIPISQERQQRLLESQINEITDGIEEIKANNGERFTVKQLERTKKSLEDRLKKLQANDRKDSVVTFEELGVDLMLVDESDNYKNLFLYTKMRNGTTC